MPKIGVNPAPSGAGVKENVAVIPQSLRPYLFHGVEIEWKTGEANVVGNCFACGKERKLSVKVDNGVYNCFVCGTKGNLTTFLNWLWDASDKATNGATKILATNRKLLYPETLSYWGVVQSVLTGDWLVPGYGLGGKLAQIYRYLKNSRTGRFTLLPTPGIQHYLHGVNLLNPSKDTIFICEGPWDGLALWEVMRGTKRDGEGNFLVTGSESSSLLGGANVVSVPGCGSIGEPFKRWLPLFANKHVVLMFDSDYPVINNGKTVPGAGYTAMRRAVELLTGAEEKPASVSFLRWGGKGERVVGSSEGYDPSKPSGYDVRDFLGQQDTAAQRAQLLGELLSLISPIPSDWVAGRGKVAKKGGTDMDCLPCKDWKTLVLAWRKALRWTGGLDKALSVMLASATSTETVGEQLWLKIIGPASSGKSTLCEAISVAKKYVLAKSTIRGFHSGFQSDKQGSQDNSLLALLKNKTLVTKDGDTLLQSPNLGQILSEARDIYDRTSRTHYRNRMSRDYEGISMTWLLCGTNSLRSIDSSELGERFLDCVITEDIDEELEDEIGWRVANRADRETSLRADGKMETRDGPDLVKAKQLTGGYLTYLRLNAHELLGRVVSPAEALHRCQQLAKFVAFMRARPSKRQREKAEREMSYRLISQHVRLAKCLAVVLNKVEVDAEVMSRVTQVALDTARGITMEIVRYLYKVGEVGCGYKELAAGATNGIDERGLLLFLRKIGVLEGYYQKLVTEEGVVTTNNKITLRLTTRMRNLYELILGISDTFTESR